MTSAYFMNKRAAVIDEADTASLHTDDPGPDGLLYEVDGGDPAYERVEITGWTSGGVGIRDGTLAGFFHVPEDTDVMWLGLWNGSQYLDKAPAIVNVIDQDTVEIAVLRYRVMASL